MNTEFPISNFRHPIMKVIKQTLIWQSIFLISGMTLCTLILLGVLTYFNFEKRCKELRSSAYCALAHDIAASIEKGLGLGLRCDELRTIPEILQRSKGDDSDIIAISVLNSAGDLFFSTDSVTASTLTPSEDIINTPYSTPEVRTLSKDKAAMFLPLLNSFNIREGILMLVYKALDNEKMRQVKHSLILTIAVIFLIITIVVSVLIRPVLRPVKATMEGMTAAIKEGRAENQQDSIDVIAFRKQSEELITEMNALVHDHITK